MPEDELTKETQNYLYLAIVMKVPPIIVITKIDEVKEDDIFVVKMKINKYFEQI